MENWRFLCQNIPDKKVRDDKEVLVTRSAAYKGYTIQELENGSIEVFEDGQKISVVNLYCGKLLDRFHYPLPIEMATPTTPDS